MPKRDTDNVRLAREILAGREGRTPEELYSLAQQLREENQTGYARRIYEVVVERSSDSPLRVDAVTKLALATYKDPDLPVNDRLKKAEDLLLGVLQNRAGLSPGRQQEALGILGAVYKQRWMIYGHKEHLHKALAAYQEGYQLGIETDLGYTAINTAYILDLLADFERTRDGMPSEASKARQQQAVAIRSAILETLLALKERNHSLEEAWWFHCTIAEAYLGLRQFDKATEYVQKAAGKRPENWRLESTARQMAHLVRIQAREDNLAGDNWRGAPGYKVLQVLLGGSVAAAESFFLGKVGLALSGGGFRASLYHIGVLARLAELDMLRHVEVISCVSGGSILGAYYYLELRNLLQTKLDKEDPQDSSREYITRQDYIDLVHRIEVNFLEGVQRNIRMRMLLEPGSNWKVLTSRTSTTTDRLGDLYERELYSRVKDEKHGSAERYLQDLLVHPADVPEEKAFDPRYENWQRLNKVPILILNATALNTCHNWQFTATYMGEPPARAIDSKIDANDRLRRMYYEDAPDGYRRMRLGHAVAASACVPGLFDPLVLDPLYADFATKLVDGGVYDNQGAAGLREQDCMVLLVSDACGQTGVEMGPKGDRIGVSLRSNDVLMARSRELQFQMLSAAQDAGLLRGVAYVHLKKDLDAEPVDWIDCPDPSTPAKKEVLTTYGIRKDVQRRLAAVRTDLDAFSDAEADALMLSGYRMIKEEFDRCIKGFPVLRGPDARWRFQDIEDLITSDRAHRDLPALLDTLDVAHSMTFKALQLSSELKVAAGVGAAAAAAGVGLAIYSARNRQVSVATVLGGAAAVAAAGGAAKFLLQRVLRNPNPLWQFGLAIPMLALGRPLLHGLTNAIDPIYLRSGPAYRKPAAPPQPPRAAKA